MKVAYLFSRYPVPSQTFCDTEMRALEGAGFEIEIYSCSPPRTSFRHGVEDWPRARVSYAPPREGLAWWEALARRDRRWPVATIARHEAEYGARYEPAKRARHAVYFADLLRRQGVEHLHVHFANRATHAALFIHELTGIPFSFTAHAQDFLVDLGSDALLGEMCARAEFVVAVSDWSRRALIEKCPFAEAKIHRVHNGLPLDRWPAAHDISSRDQRLQIFSVGRMIEFKGFANLISSCGELKERGIPFRCDIAGDGPLRETLLEQARDFTDPTAEVRLLGLLPQQRIRELLAECQVFALACRVDGKGACDVLPTVILEAMAAGKPVVSTRLAGVPEMVVDGETGLLAPVDDIPAFADALARLAAEPEMRASFGAAGRDKLVAEFSAAQSAEQLGELFLRVNAGGAPKPDRTPAAATVTAWCLFDRWPALEEQADPLGGASLVEYSRRFPGVRCLALTADQPPVTDKSEEGMLAAVRILDFLPDAMVLESWWRVLPEVAHRLESWRSVVGSGCTTDEFLLGARRALFLHQQSAQEPRIRLRHLHAVGPGAVLCAWLLIRLGALETASFSLGAKSGLAGAALRRLAPAFVGGWIVGERKLASSLGPAFHSDPPAPDEWLQALQAWAEK